MDFREEVKGWHARLGIEERDISSMDRTGGGDGAGEFSVEGLGGVEDRG